MDEIYKQILRSLQDVEETQRVRIPIAIESGSRAWGFASQDSDYDCRFIYVRHPDAYLTVFNTKNTIEFTPDAIYDIGGWDVRKVIAYLVKSNAVMLEWLRSGSVYRMDENIHGLRWQLATAFFNPVSVGWHYLSMAKNKLNEISAEDESSIKKYCYILRPLAAIRFVQKYAQIPHMEYRKNLEAIDLAPDVRGAIDLLLKRKETALEGDKIKPDKRLNQYFQREVTEIETWLHTMHPEKNRNYETADNAFRRIVRMVWE